MNPSQWNVYNSNGDVTENEDYDDDDVNDEKEVHKKKVWTLICFQLQMKY